MMTGLVQDQNLEKQIDKQIGCMSGLLQIFDRQQILSAKRIHSTKRLPSPIGAAASPEASPAFSKELQKPEQPVPASPNRFQSLPAANVNGPPLVTPPKSPLSVQTYDGIEKNSWKFCKEMPRLSLDSRATVDSKGSLCPREIRTDTTVLTVNRTISTNSIADSDDKQRRSPTSVIAKLMGLEPLPSSGSSSTPETISKPELRRSASESRVSRDLFNSRFTDGSNFQVKHPNSSIKQSLEMKLSNNNGVRDNASNMNNNRKPVNGRAMQSREFISRNLKSESPRTSPWRSPQQRRSFYNSADFFPEPKQPVSLYVDFEKKLKMRGMDEQSKDLETLKQILEVLQLKGLLHSKRPSNRDSQRNFVYDGDMGSDGSNIVLMKPWRSPASNIDHPRSSNDSGGVRKYAGESFPSVNTKQERAVVDRNGRSPVRGRNSASPTKIQSNLKSCNSIVKRKPLNIEIQRRVHETSPSRSSPINSPRLTPKRSGPDNQFVSNRSPRNRKQTDFISSKSKSFKNIVTEDESSSISESTVSTSSLTDTERSKMEEYREGRSLLERCDKLLHSIAEMNNNTESPPSSDSVIPSPVSVLDSAFDKDESSSPSPVMKRSIDFKDPAVDLEDEVWSTATSPAKSPENEQFISDDADFVYISEIFQASEYLKDDADVFLCLEKQQYLNGKDTSDVSKLHRKLVFDVTVEILDRNRQLPPWKVVTFTDSGAYLKQIWSDFQKIREREVADDLLELIGGVLKKDLAGINGWGDHPVETSEAVLDVERLIFKDLVSEAIRDLAQFAGKSRFMAPRRKLVF